MSNDMISVPRELLERWTRGLLTHADSATIGKLLAQPNTCTKDGGQCEPVALTAVAVLRDNRDGGLDPEWLLEGGTAELFAGMTLLVADNAPDLCEEDGHAELYRHPPAQAQQPKSKPTLWMVRIPDEPEDPENSPAEYEYAGSEWQRDGLLKNKGSEIVQVYCDYPPAPPPVVLPERKQVPGNGVWHFLQPDYLSWNACLAELKRLNPTL